jgi:phenylacetate-coenzyme A ligase PaaK-like adenylate-forming protein
MADFWDREFDTRPWGELTKYWLDKFNALATYVKATSDFYSKHLARVGGINSFDALLDVPYMTKTEIRDAQTQSTKESPLGSIQAARTEDIVQVISSSGTTGRPVYYGITLKDLEGWRDALANFTYTAGIRKEDVVAHVVGTAIFAGGEPYFEGMRHIGAAVVWTGGQTTQRMLETIRNMYCTAILGTTSFDLYLGENCQKFIGMEARNLSVRKVLGGGEAGLGEEQIRRKIREAWGATTIREIMGLADVMPGMWAECEEETGMHFTAHRHIMVELIDPESGRHLPWEPGVRGEPVYTTVLREATPIVRYASHDYIQVERIECKCGRTSPRIRCVGRVDDMLIYKAMNVFPAAIRDVIMTHFGSVATGYIQVVKDSAGQVKFDNPIPVDIEVKPAGQDLQKLKHEIEDKIRDLLTVRIEANLVPPESIERTPYKTALTRVRSKK